MPKFDDASTELSAFGTRITVFVVVYLLCLQHENLGVVVYLLCLQPQNLGDSQLGLLRCDKPTFFGVLSCWRSELCVAGAAWERTRRATTSPSTRRTTPLRLVPEPFQIRMSCVVHLRFSWYKSKTEDFNNCFTEPCLKICTTKILDGPEKTF